jgi:cytochrome P450
VSAPPQVPPHVPLEIVLPYPLGARATTFENPYETMIPKVHEGPEVFWATDVYPGNLPAWIVRRADDLRSVYLNTENFSKKGFSGFAAMVGESWDVIPTELDPPRHTAFRAVLNPIFSPRRVTELSRSVRDRALELIAKFRDRGECDLVKEFAVPFPVSIFLDLLDLPQERMQQFLDWEFNLLHTPDMGERILSTRAVKAYLLDVIDERRKNPGADLISNALRLKVDGRPWTPEEVFGHCFNLYTGGLDTVASTLGLHFYHLATHPDQQNQIRSQPGLMPAAREELLRAYAAVTTFRICTREFKLRGITIKPGDKVAMATPLAARDPNEYDRPNEVRFDRGPMHLTFGYGVHRCLGVHLARREIEVALEEVLSALPEFRLAPGARIPFYTGGIVHVESLPIVWER